MNIIEEYGLFWWHSEPIPKNHFAPDACVSALLTITEEGKVTLEPTGHLPSSQSPLAVLQNTDVGDIQGILKVSNTKVLLTGVSTTGGQFKSNGMSYAKYRADSCLVADDPFPITKELYQFKTLKVELTGFEEWLGLDEIKTKRTKTSFNAKYKKPEDLSYPLDDGKLEFRYDLEGPSKWVTGLNTLKLRELVWCARTFASPQSLEAMRTEYGRLEELLILLTGAEYSLDWPWLGFKARATIRLYFHRNKPQRKPIQRFEVWTYFPGLKDVLGQIYATWKRKRETLGPAFYLYLGTRRGVQLYVDHRFVNLVWGIEAFHRKSRADADSEKNIQARVQRIAEQIQNKADKKWLEGKLKHAGEPNLQQRIFATLSSLPISFEKDALQKFSEKVAKYRNQISHTGEIQSESYSKTTVELHKLSEAIAILYHLLLLQEIGVPPQILDQTIQNGHFGNMMRMRLKEIGLKIDYARAKK